MCSGRRSRSSCRSRGRRLSELERAQRSRYQPMPAARLAASVTSSVISNRSCSRAYFSTPLRVDAAPEEEPAP